MAERSVAMTRINTYGDRAHVATWVGLLNGDTGAPIEMPGSSDRSVQFVGTFGTGGTIQLQGSNDGTNYVVLTDPQGNNISKTAAGIEMITELTRYIRPAVTAGDGSTDLKCYVLVKGVN